jgi:hypothetical protein
VPEEGWVLLNVNLKKNVNPALESAAGFFYAWQMVLSLESTVY